jgi:flagellar hook-associated protein 2
VTLPRINFGGLASGLDTNSMVNQLVQLERIPIQQLQARRSGIEAKENAWTTISTRFSALRTEVDKFIGENAFSSFMAATASSEAVTVSAGDGALPGSISFRVNQLASAHQVLMDGDFASEEALVGAGTFTINIAGADHAVATDADDTLEDLAAMITSLDVGVSASVVAIDESTSRLMISAQDTGDANVFTASGDQAGLTTSTVIQQGLDAQIQLGEEPNEIVISRNNNVVDDLVPGVSITLNEVSDDPVTVTTTRDQTQATEAMKLFVDQLNASIKELNRLTDYNASSERAGALQGDSTARSLALGLRSVVSQNFGGLDGEFTFASSIGISLTRDGAFEFDEDVFTAAMASNVDDVEAFFSGDGTIDGLAAALDDFLDAAEGIDGSIARAQDRWEAELDVIDDQIERLEDRVARREAALIREFAGLETAMAQLGGLAGALAAALPGLPQ